MSPDWSDEEDSVPYADLSNPQTLNLYGYVTNNPLRLYDPTGHEGCCDVLPSMAEVDAGIAYLEGGLETAATFSAGATVGAVGFIGSQIFAPSRLGYDPAEERYLKMSSQRGKQNLDQSSGEFDHLTDQELKDEYAKERNAGRRERIKEEQKRRGARRSRQSSGKKPPAPPVRNDPASQRARQNANPVPAPVITPDPPPPPPPPKDKHGEPS